LIHLRMSDELIGHQYDGETPDAALKTVAKGR
jgi:hypothetical protein